MIKPTTFSIPIQRNNAQLSGLNPITPAGGKIVVPRANPAKFRIGILDGVTPINIDNATSINLRVQPSQTENNPVIDQTVASSDPTWNDTITQAGWENGTEEHLIVELSSNQTNIDLEGLVSKTYFAVLTAFINDGGETVEITLGTGNFIILEDNNAAADPPPENPGTAATLDQLNAAIAGITLPALTTTSSTEVNPTIKANLAAQWPEAVAQPDLTQAPVSDDQQDALDLKTDLTDFLPLQLLTSDLFAKEKTHLPAIIRKASYCYFLDEASGDFIDQISGYDIPLTGAANASVAGGRFREYRPFDGSTQYGVAATNTVRVGGPFWFVVGVNFDLVTGADGVIAEGTSTTTYNWWLNRTSDRVSFYVRRFGTTLNLDLVEVTGLSAGTDYVIVGRSDSTGLYLYVSEVGEAYENASLISGSSSFDATQYPFNIGRAFNSAVATSAYMDGKIGFVAYGLGQLSEREIDALTSAQASDFAMLKTDLGKQVSRYNSLMGVGDSLTTESFADPSWVERAATDHNPAWRFEVSGISGQTSSGITDRFLTYPLSNIERKVVAFWVGNNDAASGLTVVARVQKCVKRALLAGVEKVLILGLPNRIVYTASQATKDAQQALIDVINDAFSDLADEDSRVEYLDVHDWFVNPANYTPVDADDTADQAAGIVPRSVRDAPTGTHFNNTGSQHLADLVVTVLPS